MILLQLSSGQGPEECCLAVGLALKVLLKECQQFKVKCELVHSEVSKHPQCYKSLLLELSGQDAQQIVSQWQGVMLWTCVSPFRPIHKRKNWYFSASVFETDKANEPADDTQIVYQSCRSSGAGGQHVNTTDSAVQATHVASGIRVRVESERSQHANKRLAKVLILQKLALQQQQNMSQQEKQRWQQHYDLQRGNPIRSFVGAQFSSC
jgi:peptide chain release factor